MNRSCSVLLAVLVAQKKEVPVGLMVSGSRRGSSLVSRRLTSAHWQTPPTCRKQFRPIKFSPSLWYEYGSGGHSPGLGACQIQVDACLWVCGPIFKLKIYTYGSPLVCRASTFVSMHNGTRCWGNNQKPEHQLIENKVSNCHRDRDITGAER